MATLQITVDDALKDRAEVLFASLGLDTSTAVRIFLNAAVEQDGIPFRVGHDAFSLRQAIEDTRTRRNLYGPYATVDEAFSAMLEED